MADRIVLVTGATGKQGGATLRYLVGQTGFRVRAMTRHPEGEPARALAGLGAEVVPGDLDDTASLAAAVDGSWGVFSVQNTWEAGVDKEEEQGKRLARVARERGVQHFVYSSVGSAHKSTGIPHFDNKFRIEQEVKALGFPSHVILRPVFFMENLISPWFLQGDRLVTALKPTTRLQMIAADDIGRSAALAFTRAAELKGTEMDLAGDIANMEDAARFVSEALGRIVSYQQIPLETVRANSADMAAMLDWFERVGYSADITSIEECFGIKLLRLREWARRQRAARAA